MTPKDLDCYPQVFHSKHDHGWNFYQYCFFFLFAGDIVLTYVQIVFYLVIFMFAICILITITTFREVPLKKASSSTISTESPESTVSRSWLHFFGFECIDYVLVAIVNALLTEFMGITIKY